MNFKSMHRLRIKYLFLVICLFCSSASSVYSQEINCSVSVNYQKVQSTDVSVFQNLEAGITEFINTKRWSRDVFKIEERIDCKILIILDSRKDNSFSGSIQVTASRPVYGVNYKTSMFSVNDINFDFIYSDQQAFNFTTGTYQSELTSVLAYYMYIVLGVDYDSFSLEGGKDFYQKAFDIVTLSQTSSSSDGWKISGDKNRYWLVENLTNTVFAPFRTCLYKYHRLGLDLMKDEKQKAYQNVLFGLTELEKIHKVKPSSYLLQTFFLAKYNEIVSMFGKRSPVEKNRVVTLMIKLDPGNTKYYNKILTSN